VSAREPRRPDPIPGVELRARKHCGVIVGWDYRIRWKDPVTDRRLVEICQTAQEARDFKAKLRLLKRRGALDELEMGRLLVTDLVALWWRDYAAFQLANKTLGPYRVIWNNHLLSRVGHLQVRKVTPLVVTQLRNGLEADGVGKPTIRKGLGMLQAVWRQAIEWGEATENPFKAVAKPKVRRQITIIPFTVPQIEQMRAYLLEQQRLVDAVLISVLAYLGPRPEDALAFEYRHIGQRTVLFEQKNVNGVIVPGAKTGETSRNVELLTHVKADLAELRMANGPTGNRLVFLRPDGTPWREHDYRNWRKRHFKPAAGHVGLPNARPYDLRHTWASLRLAEQRLSLREIADQMGNSLTTLASTYSHVIADLKGLPPVDPDTLVARARGELAQGRQPRAA
jgi:integrase